MRFIVTLFFFDCLRFETFTLIDWIRQLCKGIPVLFTHYKEFETIRKASIFFILTCQWRNCCWMTVDKGWLLQLIFYEHFKEFVHDMSESHMFCYRDIVFFRNCTCFFVRHFFPEVNASLLFNCIYHMNTCVRCSHVQFDVIILNRCCAFNCLRNVFEQAFNQFHYIIIIRVSCIHFNHCKFWVMRCIDSFVTENTADFVNFFHSTDY